MLQPRQVQALLEPGLVGLKCGGGTSDWYEAMQAVFEQISVFVPGHHHATGRLSGAHGSYSNMACLSPAGAVAWNRLCTIDPERALDVQRRVLRFLEEALAPMIDDGIPGHVCDRALAAASGIAGVGIHPLWPESAPPSSCIEHIRKLAREILPEFPFAATATVSRPETPGN